MFINYRKNQGLAINSYRSTIGYANSSVVGLVEDILCGLNGSAPFSGASDLLENPSLWSNDPETQSVVEELKNLILSYDYSHL